MHMCMAGFDMTLRICGILLLIFSMVLMYIMVTVPHWANALVLFVCTRAL